MIFTVQRIKNTDTINRVKIDFPAFPPAEHKVANLSRVVMNHRLRFKVITTHFC